MHFSYKKLSHICIRKDWTEVYIILQITKFYKVDLMRSFILINITIQTISTTTFWLV